MPWLLGFAPCVWAQEEHPRLFFTAADIPAIKARIAGHPRLQAKFNGLLARANKALGNDFSSPSYYEYNKADDARFLAFAALFSDPSDPKRAQYAAKAREALFHVNHTSWASGKALLRWDGTNEFRSGNWIMGEVILEYLQTYDWLVGAGELSGEDRQKVRSRLLLLARHEHYRQAVPWDGEEIYALHNRFTGFVFARSANKRFRSLAAVGMAALAFPEQDGIIPDPENLLGGTTSFSFHSEEALQYVIDDLFVKMLHVSAQDNLNMGSLPSSLSPDGVYMEGPSYVQDGFTQLLPFLLAYKENTGVNYIAGEGGFDRRIPRMYGWLAKILMPNLREPTINDAWRHTLPLGQELVAAYSDEPDLHHWYYENVRKLAGDSFMAVLFYTPPAQPPPEPDIRTVFFEHSGQAVFRDKWGEDATYMHLYADSVPFFGHNQGDQGSFLLYAKNATLALDPGYGGGYSSGGFPNKTIWVMSAFGHNLITVDSNFDFSANSEPRTVIDYRYEGAYPRVAKAAINGGNGLAVMTDPARLQATLAAERMDHAEVHIRYDVGVDLVRSVAFPGHRYFIMEDRLSSAEEHEYAWQIHFGTRSDLGRLEEAGPRRSWTMTNEKGRLVTLDVDFLEGPEEFETRADGPTNWDGRNYPEHVFDHAYLRAKARGTDKKYLTILNPRWAEEAPLAVTELVAGKLWKVQVSSSSYDLVLSQEESAPIQAAGLRTDARFLIAGVEVSAEGAVLRSVLAKGAGELAFTGAGVWELYPSPGEMFYSEPGPPAPLPDTRPPSQPAWLRLLGSGTGSLSLTWEASSDDVGVSGYRLDLTDPYESFVPGYQDRALPAGTTAHVAVGLAPATTYYARVLAVDAAGNRSPYSPVLRAATRPLDGPPTFYLRLLRDWESPERALLVLKTDPSLCADASVQALMAFPSGEKTASFSAHRDNPRLCWARLPIEDFTPEDFARMGEGPVAIQVAGQSLQAVTERDRLSPGLGGRVRHPGGAEAVVGPEGLSDEASLSIRLPAAAGRREREEALRQKGLWPAGPGLEFTLDQPEALRAASILLPVDRDAIPSGMSLEHVRIAYFNESKHSWELQETQHLPEEYRVETKVSHFSLYQPVLIAPSAAPGLREAFVYPNPAVGSQDPILRVFMGQVERLEVTVFDLAGHVVHSGELGGAPTGISGGEYFYDYPWTGAKASGVYFAVIHGKSNGETLRARAKFAVVK